MKLLQINDTDFINVEFVVSVTLSTYYENYFLYIRMTDGNVYETDFCDSKEEALSFIELELKDQCQMYDYDFDINDFIQ